MNLYFEILTAQDLYICKQNDQLVSQDDLLTGGGFVLGIIPNPLNVCIK